LPALQLPGYHVQGSDDQGNEEASGGRGDHEHLLVVGLSQEVVALLLIIAARGRGGLILKVADVVEHVEQGAVVLLYFDEAAHVEVYHCRLRVGAQRLLLEDLLLAFRLNQIVQVLPEEASHLVHAGKLESSEDSPSEQNEWVGLEPSGPLLLELILKLQVGQLDGVESVAHEAPLEQPAAQSLREHTDREA